MPRRARAGFHLRQAERLAERLRGVAHALAVADEHDVGLEASEPPLRREEPEERMHAERSATGGEVADGPERVGDDEYAPLGPPQRALVPQRQGHDADDLERCIEAIRHSQVRDAELRRDVSAIPAVPVEQLDHARRLAQRTRSLQRVGPQEGVDEPDAALHRERVRRPHQSLVRNPAEAVVAFVAEAKGQARPTTSFTVMFAAAATPARGRCASTRPGLPSVRLVTRESRFSFRSRCRALVSFKPTTFGTTPWVARGTTSITRSYDVSLPFFGYCATTTPSFCPAFAGL